MLFCGYVTMIPSHHWSTIALEFTLLRRPTLSGVLSELHQLGVLVGMVTAVKDRAINIEVFPTQLRVIELPYDQPVYRGPPDGRY